MKIIALDTVDSTNEYAKALPTNDSRELTLVTAEFQETGRGAGTNKWESERSENLLFSIIARPLQLLASRMFALSEVTSLAICDALNSYTEGFQIKWPNDIYFGDKKAVGMLIENDIRGKFVNRSIIGVGVNINQDIFHSDAPNPISLAQILGRRKDRDQVQDKIIQRFKHYYKMLEEQQFSALHNRYLLHLYRWQEYHAYEDGKGTFQARIIDVEPTGHLIIEDKNKGLKRYAFKEVRFISEE